MRRCNLLLFFLLFLSSCSHRSYHRMDDALVKKETKRSEFAKKLTAKSSYYEHTPEEPDIAWASPKLQEVQEPLTTLSSKSNPSKPKTHHKTTSKKAITKYSVPPKVNPNVSMVEKPIKKNAITKGPLIVLDAGHGGKDTGARSAKNSYEEKELTLQTVNIVKAYLTKMGYEVILTRKQDAFISLEERAEMANEQKAALFVSIHYNYCPNDDAEGIEIFYYKDDKNPYTKRLIESRRLGEIVLSGIVKHTGATPRGVKRANFAVIRETKMPAILIEGGFLSNTEERKKILDEPYRQFLAFGIASGIDRYLNSFSEAQ